MIMLRVCVVHFLPSFPLDTPPLPHQPGLLRVEDAESSCFIFLTVFPFQVPKGAPTAYQANGTVP